MHLLESSLISFHPGLMIWTLVTFGLVLFVLKRFAFGPIQRLIDERRHAIEHSLEEAERAREEAQQMIAAHRDELAEARREATRILEEARRHAEERQRQAAAQLEDEKVRLLDRARVEIEAETRQSLVRLKDMLAELTVVATEKVVRKQLDEAEQRRLIDEALSEVDYSAFVAAEATELRGDGRSS